MNRQSFISHSSRFRFPAPAGTSLDDVRDATQLARLTHGDKDSIAVVKAPPPPPTLAPTRVPTVLSIAVVQAPHPRRPPSPVLGGHVSSHPSPVLSGHVSWDPAPFVRRPLLPPSPVQTGRTCLPRSGARARWGAERSGVFVRRCGAPTGRRARSCSSAVATTERPRGEGGSHHVAHSESRPLSTEGGTRRVQSRPGCFGVQDVLKLVARVRRRRPAAGTARGRPGRLRPGSEGGGRDETCPVSTEGGTRRVQLVRKEGRDASS
jgi:hypothetical protein